MKHWTFLAFAVFIFINCSQGQTVTDTFTVEKIPLAIEVPEGWILEELNDGICSDTTYNFVMRYQIDKPELGGRVALQFVKNKRTILSPQEQNQAKKEYQVTPNSIEKWSGHYVQYFPKKIKGCKNCGMEYMNVHVIPVSDELTLYIYFVAHGSQESVINLRGGFNSFTNGFFKKNSEGLDHFLLLNELTSPKIADTAVTSAGTLNFFYTSKFSVKKSTSGFSLTQKEYYYSPLSIKVTARAALSDKTNADTSVTSEFGYDMRGLYSTQNMLTIRCRRYATQTSGKKIELSFEATVQIEDEAMVEYYKRVVQRYASSVVLGANGNLLAFSFTKPVNPRRDGDMATMSGTGTRYGYIHHDSLLALMPGYLAARDSANQNLAELYEGYERMNEELIIKENEYDSLQSQLSPLMRQLRQRQLEDMRANINAYQNLIDDSVASCERKYLKQYHDSLDAASAKAIQSSNCSAMIDSQNIPVPDEKRKMEFIDLNAEVARMLNLH